MSKPATPFWEPLLEKLADQLNDIHKQKEDLRDLAEQSMILCRDLMQELQALVVDHSFSGQAEEIYFFKEVKTRFYSRLIYYHKVYKIELGCPVGDGAALRAYFQREVNRIREFFDENRFFYIYRRSNETYMDELLFMRRQKNQIAARIYDIHSHPDFSTHYDYIFSRIQANELLLNYLNKKLSLLNAEGDSANAAAVPSLKTLRWTDSKVALIELIYAFKAKGSFKNGKASLKEIADFIQKVFQVELTNPTRDFQEILRRKTGYTVYLDDLKDNYLQYIDDIESREKR